MRRPWLTAGVIGVLLVALAGADVPVYDPVLDTDAVPLPVSGDEPLVDGRAGGTFWMFAPEPQAIDPSNVADYDGLQVTSYLFTGLVTVAPDGSVSPGVATRWSADPGCARWTFQLARGTRFHNGEEVTSLSFKRAWERGANGRAAYLLEPIAAMDATDPDTLGVTLVRGDCEFLQRMIHPAFSPVPSVAGPVTNRKYNNRPIGNGPFAMGGEWQHHSSIRLVRYDGYRLGRKAGLDGVNITISMNPAADSYRAFRDGTADWAQLPALDTLSPTSRHQLRDALVTIPVPIVSFLVPAVTTKPLDSALARKAISLAIDRDAIAREALAELPVSATGLVPPPMRDPGARPTCDACRFDPARARRLARIAGLTEGTVLHFRYNDRAQHEIWTSAVKRQLETTLGIKVNYYAESFPMLQENQRAAGVSGISRSAWGLDYPSPGNVLTSLLSTAAIGTLDPTRPVTGENVGRYSNPRVDRLLDQARLTADEPARTALYKQAERIAIGEDLALIPLWYHRQYRLAARDRFVNLRMDWFSNLDLTVVALR
jgi:oligopeptide transport system substrate-binding protein